MKWDSKTVEISVAILRKSTSPSNAVKALSKEFGEEVTWNALRKALLKHKQISPKDVLNQENQTAEIDCIVNHLKNKSKKNNKSLEGLCNFFNKSPQYIKNLLSQATTLGYKFDIIEDKIILDKKINLDARESDISSFSIDRTIKLGILSDTHFGSKAACPEYISHFVETAYAEGVRKFVHGGDILTGNSVYRRQESELSHWGCHSQCLEACKGLPQKKDLEYYVLLGNHDMDFVTSAGVDPGLILESMRPDIKIIGHLKGNIRLQPENILIEVVHIKSSAHARSYPLEKHLMKAVSKGFLPDVVLAGHRHCSGYFPVNGVQCFMLPCFEDENIFVKYHDFVPEVGGLILTLGLNADNKIISCSPEFRYYNTKRSSATNISV